MITEQDLVDPWGGRFGLRSPRSPVWALSERAIDVELVSPGPDGRLGTRDDVRNPFQRVVSAGTPYAVASGEDRLMRRLAVLRSVPRTLDLIRAAYERQNVEVREEAIGDAVGAEVSEGTIGLGNLETVERGIAGGGGGSGYGRGAGGLGLGGRSAPTVGTGPAGGVGLASLVRERFPPTLLFRPSLVVDPSGTTAIDVPLADAVTTYLVEAIVWRADGWVWSAHTRLRVDKDVVVSAPIPPVAHRGDHLTIPLRVANRGDAPREVEVRLTGDPSIGIPDAPAQRVTVAPGDAAVVGVDVAPSRSGSGRLQVSVVTPEGEPLDAVRMPMRVVRPARRVELERSAIAAGRSRVELRVPEGALPDRGSISLTLGSALFEAGPGDEPWLSFAPSP